MFGGSYSKQNNRYFSSWATSSRMKLAVSTTLMAISHKRLVTTEPGTGRYHTYEIVICATRVTLADPLHLILGARYTNGGLIR